MMPFRNLFLLLNTRVALLRIKDTLGGEPVYFHGVQRATDLDEVWEFAEAHRALGMDTESTGINPYRRGWQLRTFQIGDAYDSYVVPARYKKFIAGIMSMDIKWIGHNGTHDIRSTDAWLGEDTGVVCAGETYIPAHHIDSRKQEDGGVGYKLKNQAERYVASDSGKWETALKKVFKTIEVPIPGETYKSGKRKGLQKVRKAHLDEGWSLVDPTHPAYIAYAGADPILTYRLWAHYQPAVRAHRELYHFDLQIQQACDKLTRRAMRLDEQYTRRLDDAYTRKAQAFMEEAERLGVENINSGAQIASALIAMGVQLTAKTPTGKYKTDDKVLRAIAAQAAAMRDPEKHIDAPESMLYAEELIHCILGAKQMMKRRESYTAQMLTEMDANGRVHPSINTLGARTSRMSVSNPPLQQLPTKDREADAE